MKASPTKSAKINLAGTRKGTRSLATVLSDSENHTHDAPAVIATWDRPILVISGLTPGHFDRWNPDDSDDDDRSRSPSEAHSHYGPASPKPRQTNSNGKRPAASYGSDWTETEVEDWVPQKARGFYRPEPKKEVVKKWVPKSESSRYNKSIRKRLSSITSSGAQVKPERQSRSRNSAHEGLPSVTDDEVPTIEGEPGHEHLPIPTITRDGAFLGESQEEEKIPPPEIIDEGELSDSEFPDPFLHRLPDPDRADCEDEADFIYKKRFAPMTDPQKFIEALSKLQPENRDSAVLYELALNTQKALKSWQDEYLHLELRTAPAANPPKKPVTGGRVPIDQQIYEDQKEADLYGYEYDPKKLPGQQDPFQQRKTGPGRIGGRELRDRREAVSRRRDTGAEATEGEGTGTEGYAIRRRTKAVQKYDGEPKPAVARPQAMKRVLSQGTPDLDAPLPKKRGRPSAADKAAMQNQAAMQSRIRQLREESAAVATSSEGDGKSPEPVKRRGRPPGSKNTQPRSDAGIKKGPRKSKVATPVPEAIMQSSENGILDGRNTPTPVSLPTPSIESEINGEVMSMESQGPKPFRFEEAPIKNTPKRKRKSTDKTRGEEPSTASFQNEHNGDNLHQLIDPQKQVNHDAQAQAQGRGADLAEAVKPTDDPERKLSRGVYHYPPSGPPAGGGYWEAQNQIQRAQIIQRNEQQYHQQIQQQKTPQSGWPSPSQQHNGQHSFSQPPPTQFNSHSRSGSFVASPTQRNPGSYPPSPTQGPLQYAPSPKQVHRGPFATSPTNNPTQHTFGPLPPGQTVPSLPQPTYTFLPHNHAQPPPPPSIQAQHDAPLKRIHGYVSDPNAAAQPSGLYQTIMRPGPPEPTQPANQLGSVSRPQSSNGRKKQSTPPGGGFGTFTVQVQQPRSTIPGTSSWRPSSRAPARIPAAAPGRTLAPIPPSGTISGAQVQDMHLANVQPPQRRRLEDVMAEQQETHKDLDKASQQGRPLQPYPPTLPSNGPIYRPEYGLPSSRLLQKQLAPAPNGSQHQQGPPSHFQQAPPQFQHQAPPPSQFQQQGPALQHHNQGPPPSHGLPQQGPPQQHQGSPLQQQIQHQGPNHQQQIQGLPQQPPQFLPQPPPQQQQQGLPPPSQPQQQQKIPGLTFAHMFQPPFDPERPPPSRNLSQGHSRQNSKSQAQPLPQYQQPQPSGQGQQHIMPRSPPQQQQQQQHQQGNQRQPSQGKIPPAFPQNQAGQATRPPIAPGPTNNGSEREMEGERKDAPPPTGQMRFVEMHGDGRRGGK
ncbi:hypothetical protein BLS_009279 [Venturia inaequalis]|uniref:Uncharacterized protein n=1 Tax=Venturia inaequalis TaxID=5025 RepID=A0A8H3VMC1_VENIN|nr:hypothetical protein EG328_001378 [Venturia inaequalis]KAE9979974.1 hypothetical protein BLS_009279 [Venturia inaequalis]KAE9990585.1 hypothetical protein EG327_001228 [Venturia inaequalis]